MTLTLLKDCEDCGGTGLKPGFDSLYGPTAHSSLASAVASQFTDRRCEACKGLRRVPTEDGRAVQELLAILRQRGELP